MVPFIFAPIAGCMDYLKAGFWRMSSRKKRLNKQGYCQSKLVTGLWKHDWRPVQFTLIVDDFGVKYVGQEHALHLKGTPEND